MWLVISHLIRLFGHKKYKFRLIEDSKNCFVFERENSGVSIPIGQFNAINIGIYQVY